MKRFRSFAVALVMLQAAAPLRGQNGAPPARVSPFTPLVSVQVPYDPSEAVTGSARVVDSAEERAKTLDTIANAYKLSNVRRQPYDLKTSFVSYGNLPSDGRWTEEDISPAPGIYRWSAEGPSFSGVFLARERLISSNQPGAGVPLRLAQVRSAIFGAFFPEIGPYAALRIARGFSDGAAVDCILVARGALHSKSAVPFAAGRSFGEAEYCLDPNSGLLLLYSPYPGLYVHYDYRDALHFHETTVPKAFTISESGKTIIEAKTESVAEPPEKTSTLFEARGLEPVGGGMIGEVPTIINNMQFPDPRSNVEVTKPEIVVLHGVVSPSGQLQETEILLSTNPALNDVALADAEKHPVLKASAGGDAGAPGHPREIVFTQEFAPLPAVLRAMSCRKVEEPDGAKGVVCAQAPQNTQQ